MQSRVTHVFTDVGAIVWKIYVLQRAMYQRLGLHSVAIGV